MIKVVEYEDEYWGKLCEFFKINAPRHPELRNRKVFDWERGRKRIVLSSGRIVGFANVMNHWGTKILVDRSNDIIRKIAGGAILNDIIDDYYAAVGLTDEIIPAYKKRGLKIDYNLCKMYSVFFTSKPLEHLGIGKIWVKILYPIIKIINYVFMKRQFVLKPTIINDTHKTKQPGKKYYLYELVGGSYIIFRNSIHPKTGMNLCRICETSGEKELISAVVNWAKSEDCDGVVAYDSPRMWKSYFNAGMWLRRSVPVASKKPIENIRIQMFTADLDNLW